MPRETEQKYKIAKTAVLMTDLESLTEYLASEKGRLYAIIDAKQMVQDSESMELYLIVA